MTGSKTTSMSSEQMRARRAKGESQSDWARLRREAQSDPAAAAENRAIGALIESRRGRPVQGEAKAAISLRLPVSVLERWRATGPGWQTRMVRCLSSAAAVD